MRRFTIDGSWRRVGTTVLAGSPLSMFRVSAAGAGVLDALERGDAVAPSPAVDRLIDRLLDAGALHPRVSPDFSPEFSPDISDREPTFGIDDVTVVTPQLDGTPAQDGRLIVDDGSEPPLDGASLRLDTNRGPAAARNAARPLVSTPLVAFVDADVDLLDELGGGSWLTPLLGHFDDPRVGLVAPRVCGEVTSSLDLGDQPARIRAGTRVSYVPAAAIVVRVEAFDAVGGFDETLRVGEDVDVVWRLDQAGWRCRYEPASRVWHEPRSRWVDRLGQHANYGTSAAPLALRHPRLLPPFRANMWTVISGVVWLFGRPLLALAVAVGSALALIPKLRAIPPLDALRLAITGHLGAVRQFAEAVRRAWSPLVAVAALCSRRARWIAAASLLAAPRRATTDVAYCSGVWRGVVRHRTLRPLLPAITRSTS